MFFREKHPDKVSEVPQVLIKFRGKEQKLLRTLSKLYGAEATNYFRAKGHTIS
jgi:hypothetical protein